MNLVSRLKRKRRSKSTRIKSGLIRVKFFASGTIIIVTTLIL